MEGYPLKTAGSFCKGKWGRNMMIFLAMLQGEEEQSKFTRLYLKYRYFMWYLANEILHDAYLAEDAVQEAFFALTRHLDQVDEEQEVKTKNFLATIIRSKTIDLYRKNSGRREEEWEEAEAAAGYAAHEPDLLDGYLEKESEEHIRSAIRKLDGGYRSVFEYKYLHGLTDREIARLLGITPKAVNVRIFRARKKLQKLLQEEVKV